MQWIKNNLVLVSGIVLPVILVLVFLVLNEAPKLLTDPAGYDFVAAGYHYDYQQPVNYSLSFSVEDQALEATITPPPDPDTYTHYQVVRLYRYRASIDEFERVEFDFPVDASELDDPLTFNPDGTGDWVLDKQATSPDGYRFEHRDYRGNGGLLGALFGMDRGSGNRFMLKKDRAHFELPEPESDGQYLQDLRFVGWIIEE